MRAVKAVHQGKYWISPQITGYLVGRLVTTGKEGRSETAPEILTMRRREILKLVVDGLTEKEIGSKLDLSHNTVHVHKNRIMRIPGVHTKAGLVRCALKHGMIQ